MVDNGHSNTIYMAVRYALSISKQIEMPILDVWKLREKIAR